MSYVSGTVASRKPIQRMNASLKVIDSFVIPADKLRDIALTLDFGTVTWAGQPFHGIAEACLEVLWDRVKAVRELGHLKVIPNADFFRLGTAATPPTTYIHADLDMGEWAGVLYLNTPEQRYGGTAFWRHKATGWDRLPDGPVPEETLKMLTEDGMDESKWEMESKIGMQFNRFITYPTRMFHSRHPNHIPAETKEDGRLVWCCFYDLK